MAKREEKDQSEVIHLQVNEGGTAYYDGKAFGDRATLQVKRGDVGSVTGPVTEVDPSEVIDVSTRPGRPGKGSRVA